MMTAAGLSSEQSEDALDLQRDRGEAGELEKRLGGGRGASQNTRVWGGDVGFKQPLLLKQTCPRSVLGLWGRLSLWEALDLATP